MKRTGIIRTKGRNIRNNIRACPSQCKKTHKLRGASFGGRINDMEDILNNHYPVHGIAGSLFWSHLVVPPFVSKGQTVPKSNNYQVLLKCALGVLKFFFRLAFAVCLFSLRWSYVFLGSWLPCVSLLLSRCVRMLAVIVPRFSKLLYTTQECVKRAGACGRPIVCDSGQDEQLGRNCGKPKTTGSLRLFLDLFKSF